MTNLVNIKKELAETRAQLKALRGSHASKFQQELSGMDYSTLRQPPVKGGSLAAKVKDAQGCMKALSGLPGGLLPQTPFAELAGRLGSISSINCTVPEPEYYSFPINRYEFNAVSFEKRDPLEGIASIKIVIKDYLDDEGNLNNN